jgi:hypothetical protein
MEEREGRPIELHPQVFAPPTHGQDPTVPKGSDKAARAGPREDEGVGRGSRRDDATSPNMAIGAPTGGFDLGELGHVERVSPAG